MANKAVPDFDVIVSCPLAAVILNTPESTLRRMRSQNVGPQWVKVNSSVFYTVSALSRYAEEDFSLNKVLDIAAMEAANPEDLKHIEFVEETEL